MDLQDIKTLSKSRIVNMKSLIETADLSVNSLNTRMSIMTGNLSVEEAEKLEIAAIETIGELMEILDISPVKLTNYLGVELQDSSLQDEAVEPYGYMKRSKSKLLIPIFELKDKVRKRTTAKGTGIAEFHELDRIKTMADGNPQFKPTGRGEYLIEGS